VTGRDRVIVMVLGVLAVVGAFWLLALSPRRHQAAALTQQVSDARTQLAQLVQAASKTPAGEKTQAANAAELAGLGKAVPADTQMASLMYQLQDAAGRAHVVFNAISPSGANGAPAGNAAAAAPAPAPAPTTTTPASGTTTTPASTDTSTPASPSTAAAGATAGPGAGIQEMTLSLVFDGRYADLERFLRRVNGFATIKGQTIRVSGRLLSIDGISLAAAPAGFPQIRASINATAYIAPADLPAAGGGAVGSSAPAAGATAAAPAPAGSAAPPTTPATVGTP
jgi:hypothetical protein